MRLISLAVLMLSAGVSPAGDDPARSLRGRWMLDKNATIEAMPGYGLGTPEKQGDMKRRFSAEVPDSTVEFTATEFVFDTAATPPEVYPYRVAAVKGEQVDLEIVSKDGAGNERVGKASAVVVSSDVLHLTQADVGFAMVLRRIK